MTLKIELIGKIQRGASVYADNPAKAAIYYDALSFLQCIPETYHPDPELNLIHAIYTWCMQKLTAVDMLVPRQQTRTQLSIITEMMTTLFSFLGISDLTTNKIRSLNQNFDEASLYTDLSYQVQLMRYLFENDCTLLLKHPFINIYHYFFQERLNGRNDVLEIQWQHFHDLGRAIADQNWAEVGKLIHLKKNFPQAYIDKLARIAALFSTTAKEQRNGFNQAINHYMHVFNSMVSNHIEASTNDNELEAITPNIRQIVHREWLIGKEFFAMLLELDINFFAIRNPAPSINTDYQKPHKPIQAQVLRSRIAAMLWQLENDQLINATLLEATIHHLFPYTDDAFEQAVTNDDKLQRMREAIAKNPNIDERLRHPCLILFNNLIALERSQIKKSQTHKKREKLIASLANTSTPTDAISTLSGQITAESLTQKLYPGLCKLAGQLDFIDSAPDLMQRLFYTYFTPAYKQQATEHDNEQSKNKKLEPGADQVYIRQKLLTELNFFATTKLSHDIQFSELSSLSTLEVNADCKEQALFSEHNGFAKGFFLVRKGFERFTINNPWLNIELQLLELSASNWQAYCAYKQLRDDIRKCIEEQEGTQLYTIFSQRIITRKRPPSATSALHNSFWKLLAPQRDGVFMVNFEELSLLVKESALVLEIIAHYRPFQSASMTFEKDDIRRYRLLSLLTRLYDCKKPLQFVALLQENNMLIDIMYTPMTQEVLREYSDAELQHMGLNKKILSQKSLSQLIITSLTNTASTKQVRELLFTLHDVEFTNPIISRNKDIYTQLICCLQAKVKDLHLQIAAAQTGTKSNEKVTKAEAEKSDRSSQRHTLVYMNRGRS